MGLFFLGIGIVWHILTREIRHYFIIREQRAKKGSGSASKPQGIRYPPSSRLHNHNLGWIEQ